MKRGICVIFVVLVAFALFLAADLSRGAAEAKWVGGSLSGRVWGYNMYDEAMPLMWARVSAYSDGVLVESVSTGLNGTYFMFLPAGLLNVTVEHPGFKVQTKVIAISEGGAAQMNFYLERSEIPIPEFEAFILPAMAVAALTLTKALTKKRHR